MADLDEVATLTVEGETDPSVDQAIAKLNAVSDAQVRVGTTAEASATVQESSAARSLSVAGAYDKLRASLDNSYASQVKFGQGVNTLDQALNQGLISEAAYTEHMGQLSAKYSGVVQDGAAVGGSVGWLSGLFGANTAEVGRNNEALQLTRETTHTLEPALKSMGASLSGMTMFTGAARGGFELLAVAIGGALAAALEMAGHRSMVANERLGTLLGSTTQAGQVTDALGKVSLSTGIDVGVLEGAFEKLSDTASKSSIVLKTAPGVDPGSFAAGTAAVNKQIAALTSFAESLDIGRASTAQSTQAINILGDAMQKGGTVSEATFEKLIALSPQLGHDLAAAFGVANIQQFLTSVGSAGVSVDSLLQHVVRFKPYVDQAFATAPSDTLTQSFDKLKTSFSNLLDAVADQAGFHDLAGAITSLRGELDDLAKEPGPLVQGFKDVGIVFGDIGAVFNTAWKAATDLNSAIDGIVSGLNRLPGWAANAIGFGAPAAAPAQVSPEGIGANLGIPAYPATGGLNSSNLPTVPFSQSNLMQMLGGVGGWLSNINPISSASASELAMGGTNPLSVTAPGGVPGGAPDMAPEFMQLGETISNGLTQLGQTVQAGGDATVGGLTQLGASTTDAITTGNQSLGSVFDTGTAGIQNIIGQGDQGVTQAMTTGWQSSVTAATSGSQAVQYAVGQGDQSVIAGLNPIPLAVYSLGPIVQSVGSQIVGAVDSVVPGVNQAFASLDQSMSTFLAGFSTQGGAGFLDPNNTNAGGGTVMANANNPYPVGSQSAATYDRIMQGVQGYGNNGAQYHSAFMNNGGDITFTGSGGPDSIYFPLYVSPGERLIVLPVGQTGTLPPTGLPGSLSAGDFVQSSATDAAVIASGGGYGPGGATSVSYGGSPINSFSGGSGGAVSVLSKPDTPLAPSASASLSGGGYGPGGAAGMLSGGGLPIYSFASGVDFVIPGSGPPDSVPLSLMVSPGERLIVLPASQAGLMPDLGLPSMSGGMSGSIYAATGLDVTLPGGRSSPTLPPSNMSDLAREFADLKTNISAFVDKMAKQPPVSVGDVHIHNPQDSRGVGASARQASASLARTVAAAAMRP